jgi:hypothetical protein
MIDQPPESFLRLFLFMDVGDRADPFPNIAVISLQRHATSENPTMLTILGPCSVFNLARLALLPQILTDGNDPLPIIRVLGPIPKRSTALRVASNVGVVEGVKRA